MLRAYIFYSFLKKVIYFIYSVMYDGVIYNPLRNLLFPSSLYCNDHNKYNIHNMLQFEVILVSYY